MGNYDGYLAGIGNSLADIAHLLSRVLENQRQPEIIHCARCGNVAKGTPEQIRAVDKKETEAYRESLKD